MTAWTWLLIVLVFNCQCLLSTSNGSFDKEYDELTKQAKKINGATTFADRYIVVKGSDKKYYLLAFYDDSLKELPDKETVLEFGYVNCSSYFPY